MKPLLLLALTPLFALAGPASANEVKGAIVLVHGAWETSSIWNEVAGRLKHDGYRVRVVTLPGRPGNRMAPNKVSMESYRRAIAAVIAKDRRPAVLVGHSFAGFPISAAAEAEPSKIRTLVYLAAYLPQNGQSLLDVATKDKDSKAGPALRIEKEKSVADVIPSARADLFANDASPDVAEAVAKAIVPEPLAPLATPVHLTARFAGVDKVYIHTARDQVVSPHLQATMVAAVPVRREQTLDTGHTPFVTDPSGVAAAIEAALR